MVRKVRVLQLFPPLKESRPEIPKCISREVWRLG
jgi:hypothetical protein